MLLTVTGFIAAGKSTAAAAFERPIFSADAAVAAIYAETGVDITEKRTFFAADPAHPAQMARAIAPQVLERLAAFRRMHPNGIAEWPRTAVPPPGDVLVVIDAPQNLRAQRVRARGVSPTLLHALLAAEAHAAPLPHRRTFFIRNAGSPEMLQEHIRCIINAIDR